MFCDFSLGSTNKNMSIAMANMTEFSKQTVKYT